MIHYRLYMYPIIAAGIVTRVTTTGVYCMPYVD